MEPDKTSSFTISASSIWPDILNQVPKDVQLFPHQVDAVKWLVERESKHNNGNLLADVMGLGKTMTTVTLISLNPNSRTLVVCSKSLICQWVRELISQNHKVYFMDSSFANLITLVDNKMVFHKQISHRKLPKFFVGVSSYGKVKPFPKPDHDIEKCISVFDCVEEIPEEELIPFRRIT